MAHPEPVASLVTVLRGLGASGTTAPAALLRGLGVPEKLLPRAEDTCAFAVEASGPDEAPALRATFTATELGFRFGRPRFHPAQIGGRAEIGVEVTSAGLSTFDVSLQLGQGSLRVRGPASELTIVATDIDPSWVAAVTTALAGTTLLRVDDGSPVTMTPFTLPRNARLGASLVVDAAAGEARGSVLLVTLKTETAAGGTSLTLEGALAAGRTFESTRLRGILTVSDLLGTGAFAGALRPLAEGTLQLEATVRGSLREPVLDGFVTAPQLSLAFHEGAASGAFERSATAPVITLTDVATLLRYDRTKVVWHRLAARAYGGTLGGEGVAVRAGGFSASLALRNVAAGTIPIDASNRPLSDLASGRLAVDLRFVTGGSAEGALALEDGVFPVLLRAQGPFAKVGLTVPPQTASAPATCTITLNARGWAFAEVVAAVPGCATTGRVDVASDGTVDGALVVRLGSELLEKSKLTRLPSLLANQLVVPVRITGAASRPHVDADLAACFGTLLSDAAGGVASLFTGSRPPPPLTPETSSSRTLAPDPFGAAGRVDAAAEDALTRELVAEGADWDAIDRRIAASRG